MNNPKISIIIPVYNAEETIGNILDKLVRQGYKNIEIIAVNDGSKDASLDIIQNYSKQDKRIIVIDQNNRGAGVARNIGIRGSTGDLLMFIDSDDDIDENIIIRLLSGLDSNTDMVVCGMDINGKKVSPVERHISGQKTILEYTLLSLLTKNILYGPCCKLFRRNLIAKKKILFPEDVDYGEDTIFVLNFLTYCKDVHVLSDVLYFYNLQVSGLSFNNRLNRVSLAARREAIRRYVWRREVFTVKSIVLYTILRVRWALAYLKSIVIGVGHD